MTNRTESGSLERELSMAELVSRVLDRGAVIGGVVVISVAGIDLIYLGLQLVVSGVETITESRESSDPGTRQPPRLGHGAEPDRDADPGE